MIYIDLIHPFQVIQDVPLLSYPDNIVLLKNKANKTKQNLKTKQTKQTRVQSVDIYSNLLASTGVVIFCLCLKK